MPLIPGQLRTRFSSFNIELIDRVEAYCRQPIFAGIMTIVGALSASLGSIYANDIKLSFPFAFELSTSNLVGIIAFWLTMFLFGILFGGFHWAQLRGNARAQKVLSGNTSDIQNIVKELAGNTTEVQNLVKDLSGSTTEVQTTVKELLALPPLGFLEEFELLLTQSAHAATKALSTEALTQAELKETIRIVLDGLLSLAVAFHPKERKARYATNIMLFRAIQSMTPEERQAAKDRLKFWEKTLDLTQYSGILDVQLELSTATDEDGDGHSPDKTLIPFALALPNITITTKTEVEDLRKVDLLPGAAWTFIIKRGTRFENAATLVADAKQGNFTPGPITMISEYLQSAAGRNVRSFISLPIFSPPFDPEGQPLGILNIHRDTDGIFKERGLELFPPLALPFCTILGVLLHRLNAFPIQPTTEPVKAP